MKRLYIIIGIVLLIVVCVFPVKSRVCFSGKADVLSEDKEKIGESELVIEINETRSILFSYSKYFEFSIDGKEYKYFELAPSSEADGLYLLSTFYYDEEKDHMVIYSLTYPEDMSYFVLRMWDKLYYLDKGAGLSYSELPVA